MKAIALVFLLFQSSIAFGQNDKKSVLEITGNAEISVTPDVGILLIELENIHINFSKAITELNIQYDPIKERLIKLGYQENQIKTTDFDVETNTIYRDGQSIDSGYIATQKIEVEFPNTRETIHKILEEFSSNQSGMLLFFEFKISDSTRAKVQTELIDLAIKDAIEKAKQISKAANIKLSGIKKIIYGNVDFGGMRRSTRVYRTARFRAGSGNTDFGFTPEDIEYTDSVIIIWDIF